MVALLLALLVPEPIAAPLPDPDPADLMRFPSAWVAKAGWQAGCRHVEWLELTIATYHLEHDPAWTNWLADARACRDVWDALDWAWIYSPDNYTPDVKAACRKDCVRWLMDLRTRLGDNYERGLMPPALPYWHFRRLP